MSHNDEFQSEIDGETLATVEQSLPRVAPPADLFDRILAEIRPEATIVPIRPRAHRRAVALAVGALAVAAAVLITVVVAGEESRGPAGARAAVTGKSDPAVKGEAVLYGSTAVGGTVRVELLDVPQAPAGHHYEVWVLRRDAGGEMEAVGSFAPTSESVQLDLPLPGPGDYAAIDISVEENGGPPAHSGTSLAGGTFS
jgi:anti-sigma-K factor RskA